ncbi:hypothetical protein [Streptomyces sp. NEAU-S7GS2]|uniref:hypothetical protein n=1 Tax=Streptomyces sp. NEAU-S7GS2 TaxID=2202000 RepID=UPI000D6EE3EB|nr:hypothetical protein [Streptomyces sp. NEAU-S7GS2]AWN30043.1 hypothetical protein DKG71_31215 [Streptomyces sp. NEAU-S7GS2]
MPRGHWIDDNGKPDPFGPGRIDSPRATLAVACTARTHTTHDGSLAKKASDHLLVTADFALDDMTFGR